MRIENALTALALGTACTLFLTSYAATPANSSLDKKIAKAIESSQIVPNAAVSASVEGSVATITVLLPELPQPSPGQLKVDAVLLAKRVLDSQPGIARVKTRFCEKRQPKTCKQVVVTIGDIKAFAGRQISQKELLGALEVLDVPFTSPLRPTFAPPPVIKPRFETVSEVGLPATDFSTYQNRQVGVSFSYPKQLEVHDRPSDDKDAITKINGAIAGDTFEIRLGILETNGMSKESLARLLEEAIFGTLNEYRKVKEGHIYIGRSRKLDAFYQTITFKVGTIPFEQTHYFVSAGPSLYLLTYTNTQGGTSKVRPFIDHSLASFSLTNTGTAADKAKSQTASTSIVPHTSMSSSAPQQLPLKYYRNENGKIGLSIPSNWKLEESPEKELVFRASGTASDGLGGMLALYSGDAWPGSTLEQFAEIIEKEHLQNQKAYRKLSEQHQIIGPLSTTSIVQQVSYDSSGIKTVQNNMFFGANGHLYALCLVTPGWRESDARELFSKISSSLRPTDSLP